MASAARREQGLIGLSMQMVVQSRGNELVLSWFCSSSPLTGLSPPVTFASVTEKIHRCAVPEETGVFCCLTRQC